MYNFDVAESAGCVLGLISSFQSVPVFAIFCDIRPELFDIVPDTRSNVPVFKCPTSIWFAGAVAWVVISQLYNFGRFELPIFRAEH